MGFTLFELLVVLAILTIVAGVTIPALTRSYATELKATARTIAAGLRQSRSLAATRNESVVLSLDLERKRFGIAGESRMRALPATVDVSVYTARSELLGERQAAIRFFPDGSSTGGRITLASGELRLYIDVDWLTGRVRILDSAPDTS